jgi:hypothetical protein
VSGSTRVKSGVTHLTPEEGAVLTDTQSDTPDELRLRPLDRVGASMFLTEAINLSHYILYLIQEAEDARGEWLENDTIAASHARASDKDFSHSIFMQAGQNTVSAQGKVFEVFEATCAAWARLSLLFFPLEGRSKGKSVHDSWRLGRGMALQRILALDPTSLLADRDFRDSWMHFDERMDLAFQQRWLGNRQQFTRTSGVEAAAARSIRVFDMELLEFHYRTKDGKRERVLLSALKGCIHDLLGRFPVKRDSMAFLPLAVPTDGDEL